MNLSRTCDIICHIVRSPRFSPFIFAYCKNWRQGWPGTEASEGWFLCINKFTIIIMHMMFVSIDKGECKVNYDQMGMSDKAADGYVICLFILSCTHTM